MNVIMWILHIVALLFGFFGLIITIPLHLILRNQTKAQATK